MGHPGPPWQPQLPPPHPGHVGPARAQRRSVAAIVVAIFAAGVMIAVAIVVAGNRSHPGGSAPTTPTVTAGHTGTAEANRAFCTDIAPLMAESDKTAQAFSRLDRKAPDWKAGAQAFMDATTPWLDRMQPVIDSHGDADPFLQRSMQRFVDDTRYLLADLAAGEGPEWLPYDQTSWNDGLAALSGVAHVCYTVGVRW